MSTPEFHLQTVFTLNKEGHISCHQNARRLVVIGTSGAGKTTVARRIASILDVPHIEFDAYRYGPNWTKTPDDMVRDRLSEALRAEAWVADGNYFRVARDVVWPRTTTVVWLDYSIHVVMWRLFARTMRRGILQEEVWNGNRERLWWHFVTRDSLFLWALKTHWSRRRTMPAAFARPEHAHLDVVHLRSTKSTNEWLETLSQ